jgi:acyl carrier protein
VSAPPDEEVFGLVKGILASEFGVDASKLVPDAAIQEDLDLDSIDAVDLVARLEEETGLKVGDEELANVRTLADVVRVVQSGMRRLADAS